MTIKQDNSTIPDPFYGRMNDPMAGANVTGPCGDTMEFYMIIENNRITQVKYYTDGCQLTRLCGKTVAHQVQCKSIADALWINPGQILEQIAPTTSGKPPLCHPGRKHSTKSHWSILD